MLLKSIATVCISGSLPEKLTAIADAGFKAVEIFENDLVSSDLSPQKIRRVLDDLGLQCCAYQPFRDFEGLPNPLRAQALDRAERKFDLMAELGTDLMLVCSSVHAAASSERSQIIDDFCMLAEHASKRSMRIAYEALAWGKHVRDHRDAYDIVVRVDHPAMGLALDSFHSLSLGIPTASIAEMDARKINFVQLADAPLMDCGVKHWSRHYRCFPGQGDLNVSEYARTLLDIGYQGPISLEIFNDSFRAASTEQIAVDGMRALNLTLDRAQSIHTPSLQTSLPPKLPAVCSNVSLSFIEFAVPASVRDEFEKSLKGLGLRKTGEHTSRSVERWSRDKVNVIVNSEEHGFAYSYALSHGVSVCAIGLVLDDVDPVLARAKALNIQTFHEGNGLDAYGVPALRGIGGTLIYLLEHSKINRIYEQEFTPIPSPDIPSNGDYLGGFDHVGIVVEPGDFLSWQLYWSCLFATERSSESDLLDPGGLIHSVALKVEGIKDELPFRLTCNASDSIKTLAARFVENFWGSGVQHVALHCTNIFSENENMKKFGLNILNIPENYYDDLAARFSLDDTLVKRLKAGNIMYDVDESGSFFHFYSRAYEKGVFFEVVQRNGYEGYGASNSQVRLSAQSRYRPSAFDL